MRKTSKRWLIPLSAAMIALLSAGTAFAADMVNVKIENTRGGYVEVYYEYNEEGYQAPCVLPIGETVQVPQGTTLKYKARALDYRPKGGDTYYQGVLFNVEASSGSTPVETEVYNKSRNGETGFIEADSDLTITGVFKAYEKKKILDDDEEYEPWYTIGFKEDEDFVSDTFARLSAGAFSEQLYL